MAASTMHLTTREVAAIYQVTPRTVRDWVRRGRLQPYRICKGGRMTFHPLEVRLALSRHNVVVKMTGGRGAE